MNQDNPNNKQKLLYIIIIALSISLIGMGAINLFSLYRLIDMQEQVSEMEDTLIALAALPSDDGVTETNLSAEETIQNDTATDNIAEVPEETPSATSVPEDTENTDDTTEIDENMMQGPMVPSISDNEGTLSPSSSESSTFSYDSDKSIDNLLSQIANVLPSNNGRWSVYVSNLVKNTEGSINDTPMQSASLIKLFIMGTVYENYSLLSQQHDTAELNSLLSSMITVSDNDSANTLVTWLGNGDAAAGMAKVNDFCSRHNYTNTSMGRLLLQSNENGDNYTSVNDCGRFLKDIYQTCNGTATSPSFSESSAQAMYYLLKMQTRRNKIPAGIPEGVGVANKTGELANVENDAAILYDTAKGIDVVVCFMSENLSDTASAQTTIAECSHYIYGYFNE